MWDTNIPLLFTQNSWLIEIIQSSFTNITFLAQLKDIQERMGKKKSLGSDL